MAGVWTPPGSATDWSSNKEGVTPPLLSRDRAVQTAKHTTGRRERFANDITLSSVFYLRFNGTPFKNAAFVSSEQRLRNDV